MKLKIESGFNYFFERKLAKMDMNFINDCLSVNLISENIREEIDQRFNP